MVWFGMVWYGMVWYGIVWKALSFFEPAAVVFTGNLGK